MGTVGEFKEMDASKAAGRDGIRPAKVTRLAEVLVKTCAKLFNAQLDQGRLPTDRLQLTVTPMRKGVDRDNWGSYMPVSLTSDMLKTLESIVRDGILNHLEAKNLMMVKQYGFGMDVPV